MQNGVNLTFHETSDVFSSFASRVKHDPAASLFAKSVVDSLEKRIHNASIFEEKKPDIFVRTSENQSTVQLADERTPKTKGQIAEIKANIAKKLLKEFPGTDLQNLIDVNKIDRFLGDYLEAIHKNFPLENLIPPWRFEEGLPISKQWVKFLPHGLIEKPSGQSSQKHDFDSQLQARAAQAHADNNRINEVKGNLEFFIQQETFGPIKFLQDKGELESFAEEKSLDWSSLLQRQAKTILDIYSNEHERSLTVDDATTPEAVVKAFPAEKKLPSEDQSVTASFSTTALIAFAHCQDQPHPDPRTVGVVGKDAYMGEQWVNQYGAKRYFDPVVGTGRHKHNSSNIHDRCHEEVASQILGEDCSHSPGVSIRKSFRVPGENYNMDQIIKLVGLSELSKAIRSSNID